MKPKFNKLITLMLLLSTFAFIMEAEQRVSNFAMKELSKWASLLPSTENTQQVKSKNPYAQTVSLREALLSGIKKEDNPIINQGNYRYQCSQHYQSIIISFYFCLNLSPYELFRFSRRMAAGCVCAGILKQSNEETSCRRHRSELIFFVSRIPSFSSN